MSATNARSKLNKIESGIRVVANLFATMLLAAFFVAGNIGAREQLRPTILLQTRTMRPTAGALQGDSLCAKTEHIIFSCRVKRSAKGAAKRPAKRLAQPPAKIVSLCASSDLDKGHGYLQYRFGLPGRIELEFPKSRQGTQQMFTYTHYFRYQFDLTEISFNIDGYEYSVFDDYNGEEKPATSLQGVSVTAPGKPKDVTLACRTKLNADYSRLQDVLLRE